VLGSAWILGLGLLAWSASLALFLVLSGLVYGEIEKMYGGLGSQPPVLARLYFAASRLLWPAAALVALAGPAGAIAAGRNQPARSRAWSRRYALSSVLGVGWALLGVAAWYLCVTSIIAVLS
jgi:hypothetical protein